MVGVGDDGVEVAEQQQPARCRVPRTVASRSGAKPGVEHGRALDLGLVGKQRGDQRAELLGRGGVARGRGDRDQRLELALEVVAIRSPAVATHPASSAHSASSGMWRSRCSAIVRRTQRLGLGVGHPVAAEQHLLVVERQPGDLPAAPRGARTASRCAGARRPRRSPQPGRSASPILRDRPRAQLTAQGEHVALVVGVVEGRRGLGGDRALSCVWRCADTFNCSGHGDRPKGAPDGSDRDRD